MDAVITPGGGLRVLLVEGDRRIARRLGRGLREEGFAADVVVSGDAAQEYDGRIGYDVIVIDWLLAGRSGLLICRDLRRRDPSTPILVLMARDSVANRVAALDAGADDCLAKPFAFEELLVRIRTLLRRAERARPRTLTAGGLRLDRLGHRVTRGGRLIHLTPREYALLETIMLQAPDVVTHTRLVERVWGPDPDLTDSAVAVHMTNLRRKIDRRETRSLIETVRGRGYRLAVSRAR
jgi:two-component system, OmpR family, response regulator